MKTSNIWPQIACYSAQSYLPGLSVDNNVKSQTFESYFISVVTLIRGEACFSPTSQQRITCDIPLKTSIYPHEWYVHISTLITMLCMLIQLYHSDV